MRAVSAVPVAIPSGQAVSAAVDLRFTTPLGIEMDSAWDTASLTFETSRDGVTYRNMADINGEYTIPSPAAGQYIALDPLPFLGVRFLIIRSGTSAAPVNQTAARSLAVVIRELNN